jgi:hypothetical protein
MENLIAFEDAETVQCIVNSANGIYSGQVLAERYQEYFKSQYPDKLEALNDCLEGPENDFYWESIEDLLSCFIVIDGIKYGFVQLEDIFMIEFEEYKNIDWDSVN